MLTIAAALLFSQDPEWAMQVHRAGRASGYAFAETLTGAQRDACFEILDRLGAAQSTAEQIDNRISSLNSAIQGEEALDRGEAAEPMRQQALVIARRYRDDMEDLALENRRNIHALGSIAVTVCRPAGGGS